MRISDWSSDVCSSDLDRADSGILTDNAASLTISDITTTGDRRAHYSVHVGAVHNVLVKDLKVENPVVHPLSINTRSTRSVFLRAVVGRDAIIDQHSGSNHQNLFDQVEMHIDPKRDEDGWHYQLWVGRSEEHTSELQSLMRISYAV